MAGIISINADGENLYAPTELLPLAKPLPERKSGGPFSLGNKFLGTDIVEAGLLKIQRGTSEPWRRLALPAQSCRPDRTFLPRAEEKNDA